MSRKPPAFFDKLLNWYCEQTDLEDIQGDLYEVYEERAEVSARRANYLFAIDVLRLFVPFTKNKKRATWLSESYNFNIRNQVVVSFRHLKKFPFVNGLKIAGLAVAISALFFISDYVSFHKNFDQFHEKKDRIYRVVTTVSSPDLQDVTAWSHGYIRDLIDEFPQVEQIVRLLKVEEAAAVKVGNRHFQESEVFYVDPEFSDVFSYKWMEGSATTALLEPNGVVLTKKMAEKYFKRSDQVVGEIITINNRSFTVTGLVADIPANSDFTFDLLIPMIEGFEDWMFVYLLLQPNASAADLENQFAKTLEEYNTDYTDEGVSLIYDLENIADVHFSDPKLYDTPKMSRDRIRLFQTVGWIILLIALVNYVNLYAAQLLRRVKSTSIQLVVGATRKQLFLQFLTEAGIYLGMALTLGVGLTFLLTDVLSFYADFQFFSVSLPVSSWVLLALIFIGVILMSAFYALMLTSRRANIQLAEAAPVKAHFRKGLIGLQFALSFAMILATWVIYLQTNMLRNQELGFDADQAIRFQFPDYIKPSQRSAVQEGLTKLDFISSMTKTTSNAIPGMDPWVNEYYVEALDQTKLFAGLEVDAHYLETLDIKLVAGEAFDRNKHRAYRAFLVNEAFVKHLGWDNSTALGERLGVYGSHDAPIIGIVKNFYFNSPHQLIQPMVILYDPNGSFAIAKMAEQVDMKSAISRMELVWNEHLPGIPFNFSFVMAEYEEQFRQERAAFHVLGIVGGLIIGLSLLGMYAILLMLAKFREKELGIRKVNGASKTDLFALFSREFVKIVFIALVAITPVIWFGMDQWLARYPIRIALNPIYFVVVAATVLLIAAAVIFVQAARSYRANTVDALKYE